MVRVRRGCTCCGCGCVLPAFVLPLVAALLWAPLGSLAAVLLAGAAMIASGHALAAGDRFLLRRRDSASTSIDDAVE